MTKKNDIDFESENTEYKIKLSNNKESIEKWAKTLVGFANTYGGILYVGINDDGKKVGLERKEVDATKNLVLLVIDRFIFPHIKVKFTSKSLKNDKYLLLIDINQNDELVIYKDGDYNEKVYIRENGATIKASINQIIQLGKRKFGFDNTILDKTFYRKDFSKYYKLIKKYRRDKFVPNNEFLISKNLINENNQLTSGFDMFSDKYDNDLSLVTCRLWNGYDKGVDEVLDKKDYKGPLGEVFQEVISFIDRNSRNGFIKLKDGSRMDTKSYPETAVREALINALAHRDYSIDGTQIDIDIYKNRLEICSPGSWLLSSKPASYAIDKIPSIRRNKIICNSFEVAGLMEKSGSGFKKIHSIYKNIDINQPKLETIKDTFTIVLFDLLYSKDIDTTNNISFGKYDEKILDYCLDEPKTREEIQNYISYKSRQHLSSDIIKPLLDSGLLSMTEAKKSKMQKYKTNKQFYLFYRK